VATSCDKTEKTVESRRIFPATFSNFSLLSITFIIVFIKVSMSRANVRANIPKLLGTWITKTLKSSDLLRSPPSPLVAEALARSIGPAPSSATGVDYQVNVSSSLAKALSLPPQEVAMNLATSLMAVNESTKEEREIMTTSFARAIPGKNGFINFALSDTWLFDEATNRIDSGRRREESGGGEDITKVSGTMIDNHLAPKNDRILVDFASPNVGKELHVGHLRSGVIGDTLSRILKFASSDSSTSNMSEVVRVSHVGDCGLPASLVLAEDSGKEDLLNGDDESTSSSTLPSPAELSRRYEQAKKRSVNDKVFADKAQLTLRKLQRGLAAAGLPLSLQTQSPLFLKNGSPSALDLKRKEVAALGEEYPRLLQRWYRLCKASRLGYMPLFERLGVDVDERPESLYAPLLEGLVTELMKSGHAVEENGAVGLFVDGPSNPPFLIRKSDGGYLYATIDLACLRTRLLAGFSRIVYVTDHAQNSHFQLLFKSARWIGWIGPNDENFLAPRDNNASGGENVFFPKVSLEHASFGLVTGEGGKKLSSRDGSASEATLQALLESGAEVALQSMQMLQAAAIAHQTERADKANKSSYNPPSSKRPPLTGIEAVRASERISASAIRFFDLSHKRTSNYAFSPQRALSLKGQSAPYVLYAVTRLNTLRLQAAEMLGVDAIVADIAGQLADNTDSKNIEEVLSSIERVSTVWGNLARVSKARCKRNTSDETTSILLHPAERALALILTRLPEATASAARLLQPHILAEHVLNLAAATHVCYDTCRVLPPLDAIDDEQDWTTSSRRLLLLGAADADIRLCCHLLGVEVVSRM